MRSQWRFLLTLSRSSIQTSKIQPFHSQVQYPDPQVSLFSPFLRKTTLFPNPINPGIRSFSSEPVLEQPHFVLTDVLSKSSSFEEIRKELVSNDVKLSHEMVLEVLGSLEENPDSCRGFFDWIKETKSERLSCKAYNLMLRALGRKDCVEEFWGLVEDMKKKGYGVKRRAYTKAFDRFAKEGMQSDLDKLKKLFEKPDENSVENVCSRICKVIRESDGVQKRVREMNVDWSSELIEMVIKKFRGNPMKALMFFWWVEEDYSFKHDECTYNAMVSVLGREDCIEKFWHVVEEMKGAGCEMEMYTYVKVSRQFLDRRKIKDAVDLYELMMRGGNKLDVKDSVFLLRKIVVAKELNLELFSRVVKIFTESGHVLRESILDGVLKSLSSVGRLQECGKILKSMEKDGFVLTSAAYENVIFYLSKAGRTGEAVEIINKMVNEKHFRPRHTTFKMLIEKLLVRKNMKEALDLITLMKDQGFPPCLDPFVNHIAKSGNGDDALSFMKKINAKRVPSVAVCIQMLEAFFKVGRRNQAYDCFSKCPSSIRNHADVLNLFSSMKSRDAAVATTVSA